LPSLSAATSPLCSRASIPNFHTPHISILLYTVLLLAFTLWGNFRWNITLSAIARLFTYSSIAIALLCCGAASPCARFRLPAGKFLAVLAIAFCVVLFARAPLSNSSAVVITILMAGINYAAVRSRQAPT
jgi:hypothetical protein